ncbi:hypothetical protein AURDEDRAFT_131153 [Auricularia subglabra TFB-10046 SS5]|uniref:Uncharacterized protein n=1 Tax=Auricularia subglabra (strain TFB-10046 / SS5) TaxID=717982 RepID=J0D6J1_AURST|nr:hypothetical protein AURDEDRAFT_131153 [Auricularia subglabra TFB-10046 SS5]
MSLIARLFLTRGLGSALAPLVAAADASFIDEYVKVLENYASAPSPGNLSEVGVFEANSTLLQWRDLDLETIVPVAMQHSPLPLHYKEVATAAVHFVVSITDDEKTHDQALRAIFTFKAVQGARDELFALIHKSQALEMERENLEARLRACCRSAGLPKNHE